MDYVRTLSYERVPLERMEKVFLLDTLLTNRRKKGTYKRKHVASRPRTVRNE